MKAEELMLGDIVYDAAEDVIRAVARVEDHPDCNPVPILTKNLVRMGFRQVEKEDGGKKEWIYILPLSDNVKRNNATYHSARDLPQNFFVTLRGHVIMAAKVRYFHELQHLLSHCGQGAAAARLMDGF